ncbi:hypothetical protein D9M69_454540 [compost metagenome]
MPVQANVMTNGLTIHLIALMEPSRLDNAQAVKVIAGTTADAGKPGHGVTIPALAPGPWMRISGRKIRRRAPRSTPTTNHPPTFPG